MPPKRPGKDVIKADPLKVVVPPKVVHLPKVVVPPKVVRPLGTEVIYACLDKIPTATNLPPRQIGDVQPPPQIASDGTVSTIGISRQPLAVYTELMWDTGQTLRVKMMGGSAFVRSKVRQFAEAWMTYANITFDFVDPAEAAVIKVSFVPGGSWSKLGRDALGVPFDFATMNFGWFDDSTGDTEFSRTATHEFGHALGLIHEHQAPTSGIQWDREKTYAYFKAADNWDRAEVDAQVFQKYSVMSTNYSAFDPNSIMEYWVPASLTLDGKGVSGGTQLSAIDKEYIGMWYPFPVSPTNASGLLRTGDDCDEIDFTVEYNVVGANDVVLDREVDLVAVVACAQQPAGVGRGNREGIPHADVFLIDGRELSPTTDPLAVEGQ